MSFSIRQSTERITGHRIFCVSLFVLLIETFSGSDNNGRGFRHCILSCRAEHTSQVRKKVSGEEKARVMEQFGNIFITAYWKSLVPLCTCAALFSSSSSSFPPSWPGLRNVGTVYGCRLQTIQTGTQEPAPAFPQRKKKVGRMVLVLWRAVRCGRETRPTTRLQLRHFFCQTTANKFISPSPLRLLPLSIATVRLRLLAVHERMKNRGPDWDVKSNSSSFLEFFPFFLSSSPLRRIYFQGQS